jgi:hypothetical protein
MPLQDCFVRSAEQLAAKAQCRFSRDKVPNRISQR